MHSPPMSASESFAQIISVFAPEVFISPDDDILNAEIKVANETNLAHSAQVVFRGYIKKEGKLIYEFLHEQAWILIKSNETNTYKVAVEAWLPRFPPTMMLFDKLEVEYCVRASVDPWCVNNYTEKIFRVHRKLVLKMPHICCYRKHIRIKRCVQHRGWYRRKCYPINGDVWVDKGVYSSGENIKLRWQLQLESKPKVKTALVQCITYRIPTPDSTSLLKKHVRVIASQKIDEILRCELFVPQHLPVTMAMTLWNVLTVQYEVRLQIKIDGVGKFVNFSIPITIASEPVLGRAHKVDNEVKLFSNLQIIDDDTDDDDDEDSSIYETANNQLQQSDSDQLHMIVERLELRDGNDMRLTNTEVTVCFKIYSTVPEKLSPLRLLLQGEVRAGSAWYTFLRYKAQVSSSSRSLFSPGDHSLGIPLPFRDSQYDTNILPPSIDDDIRYMCYVTTRPWQINDYANEVAVFVDRMVDTWAKQKFDSVYSEELAACTIHMTQRAFQRGKYAYVSVTGNLRNVQLRLQQQRRLRIPGLKIDDSYCHERVVSSINSPEQRNKWPEQWALHIPGDVPPSIEITYWNVLALNYKLRITLITEDGHKHIHNVPIWIGCTDDKLQPPKDVPSIGTPNPEYKKDVNQPETTAIKGFGNVPKFEVVQAEETKEIPLWIDRFENYTYS